MYLLDTNICIYAMKNRFPSLTHRLLSERPEEVALSSITVFELEYGAEKSQWGLQTRENLRIFLYPFTILPFSDTDSIVAAQIRAKLEREGQPIGPYDLLIAAQALSRDLTLVTHNTKEFSRIPMLRLEDWTGSTSS